MFTLVAFSTSQDNAALATVAPATGENHVGVNTNNTITVPPELSFVGGMFALGPNITRAQLQSPKLRQFINPEISPLDVAALPTAPSRFTDYRFTPIDLDPNEQVTVQAAENAAGASRETIGIWLVDGPVTPAQGDVRTVRFTTAQALTANAWTSGAITLDQALPAGTYQLVGARVFSANLQLFRFILPGYAWRPGGIGVADATIKEPDAQRYGNFGAWGVFPHNILPVLEALANGADAGTTGVLDLIKLT